MVRVIQISVGGFDNNFSYLLIGEGENSNQGILIDPTGDKDKIEREIKKHKVRVIMQILTHNHPDHCELVDYFSSKKIPLKSPNNKSLGSVEKLFLLGEEINIISTPGHKSDCVCIKVGNNLFTGDTLFVRGVGTTAYGGDDLELEETLAFLSTINQELIVWPGHNYGGASATLKEALNNSHLKPTKKILERIKRRVEEYNKQMHVKF